MLRVLIRYTSYSSLYFSNQPIATFIITYNCLVEIELHREIYHFTHERQALKLDLNQHSAISRSFYHLNYWAMKCGVSLYTALYSFSTTTILAQQPNLITSTGRTSHFMPELWLRCYPNVLLGSCIGLPGLPLIGRALNVPLARLERDREPYWRGYRRGLLLEDKKPLERTPHFFEPEVGECVNATGQLAPDAGVEPTLKV